MKKAKPCICGSPAKITRVDVTDVVLVQISCKTDFCQIMVRDIMEKEAIEAWNDVVDCNIKRYDIRYIEDENGEYVYYNDVAIVIENLKETIKGLQEKLSVLSKAA